MPPSFDINAAERFANLAGGVHREYSNKISRNLNSDVDVAPPRKLTPVKILLFCEPVLCGQRPVLPSAITQNRPLSIT